MLEQADMKDVMDKLNVELVKAPKASEPPPLANDIEGKAAFVAMESRRLNEADIATASALVKRRKDFQVEITELEFIWSRSSRTER